jgi:phosphoribosylformylglycinamidine cyclo-ligase
VANARAHRGAAMSEPVTYAAAGVDTEAGDRAVELM